jgi:catechol 2,3-dioxygenase-like lactoylglutathione lyase family enzyme
MMPAVTVHHIGMWVQDLSRSGRFYSRVMGFEKQYDYRAQADIMEQIFGHHADCRVEVYQRDEVRLELFQPEVAMTSPTGTQILPAINHFSLKVSDKETFCRQAREKGASIVEVDRGGRMIYFIRDPNGILIEIKDD